MRATWQADARVTARLAGENPTGVESSLEVTMADKCAHPPCECKVEKGGEFGKYCSAHCQMKSGAVELRCDCHHPECR